MFRDNEIIVLVGAGCSVDAGIPTSKTMATKLEELLNKQQKWSEFRHLYNFMKSAILYADGINGSFADNFDIEKLMNVTSELEKKQETTLYPFIGSWNPRLLELTDHEFKEIKEFRNMIQDQLKDWVTIPNYSSANYYKRFFDFQSEYNFPLRMFSLNYDRCLEENTPDDKELERGFDPDSRTWDGRRFDAGYEHQPDVYLYKMHGSIDWMRDENKGHILMEVDKTPEKPDLIFGTNYKMQYIDPYLFYTYEFRKYTLESKVILTVGYSFRDEHVNGILGQALKNEKTRRIIAISPSIVIPPQFNDIKDQIVSVKESAKDFLCTLSIERINKLCDSKLGNTQ